MSILRIEPVRAGRDDAPYECVAENGVADAVSAEATLSVYESEYNFPFSIISAWKLQSWNLGAWKLCEQRNCVSENKSK